MGFAAEPHGTDVKKIVDGADLGGGMPLETHPRIGIAHAAAIVYHLHKFFACVFYEKLYFSRPGVYCVL